MNDADREAPKPLNDAERAAWTTAARRALQSEDGGPPANWGVVLHGASRAILRFEETLRRREETLIQLERTVARLVRDLEAKDRL